MSRQEILQELPFLFSNAVRLFWETRDKQADAQKMRGVMDQGSRSSVTGGKQMDGFAEALVNLLVRVGVDRSHIFLSKTLLPGFYRPTKEWDLIVISEGRLIAAVELKSQVGPSFGNNFNNRVEEALRTAEDIWTAYREGAFDRSPAPWLGYLFLLEDCPKARIPTRVSEPHFKVFPEYKQQSRGASYAQRYEWFCRKLVRERKYNAVCYILTNRSRIDQCPNYEEPADDLSVAQFVSSLLRHVAAQY